MLSSVNLKSLAKQARALLIHEDFGVDINKIWHTTKKQLNVLKNNVAPVNISVIKCK